MHTGYIKLWRKTMKSDMYESLTAVQRDVMVQCLMLANHAPKSWEWQGKVFTCKSGQFVTSIDSLQKACATGTSRQNVRTALIKLATWGFLTNESTKTGRLITIMNWDTYQGKETLPNTVANQQPTDIQPTANRQLTTNKNGKKVKNVKNKDIEIPSWIPRDPWNGFIMMRKRIKAPLEGRAITLIINKLKTFKDKGVDIGKILDQSTESGWKSIYPLKDGGGNGQGNFGKGSTGQASGHEDYDEGTIGPD